jgi:cell division protein FtsW (lipid II flippase)
MELLLALSLVALSMFLVVLMRSAEIRQSYDVAEEVFGLKIAAGVMVVPGVFMLLAAFGLWKDKLWGWWLALLIDLGLFAILFMSVIDDGWRVAGRLAVLSLVPVILLFTPRVRKHYWGTLERTSVGTNPR